MHPIIFKIFGKFIGMKRYFKNLIDQFLMFYFYFDFLPVVRIKGRDKISLRLSDRAIVEFSGGGNGDDGEQLHTKTGWVILKCWQGRARRVRDLDDEPYVVIVGDV